MTYPNAYKGVSKLFLAEIIQIIASVLLIAGGIVAIVGSVFLVAIEGEAETADTIAATSAVGIITTVAAVIAVIGGVVGIVAYILKLVGLKQAGRDEESFQQGFWAAIAALVLTAVANFVGGLVAGSTGNIIGNIASIFKYVCDIFIFLSIINGVGVLAEKLGNSKIAEQGKTLFKVYACMLILTAIANLISAVFGSGEVVTAIAGVMGIIAGILTLVAYIIYLVYLGRAKKMLRDN